jgi:hypothetical protein
MEELQAKGLKILISHNGKFVEKGLKRGLFVLGADTFVRLKDPKFYNNDLKEIKKAVCMFTVDDVKFLVFPRA